MTKSEIKTLAQEVARHLREAQSVRFLTELEAAERLRVPFSTFRKVYFTRFGLRRVNLNDAVKGDEPLKNCYRFIESEVDAIVRKAVEARDKRTADWEKILS